MHCDILTAFLPSLNSGKFGGVGGGQTLGSSINTIHIQGFVWLSLPESLFSLVFFFILQKLLRMSLPCFSSVASYVSAMVPVKSPREYYVQQEVIVLFCETVER